MFSVPSARDISPQASAAAILGTILLMIVVAGVLTSFFTIPQESEGVVLRFGKYHRTVQPGLHGKLPYGIEQAYPVPTRRQLKLEFGFNTPGATNPFQTGDDTARERLMVTGDLNAALVEWVVQYRISDPLQFLFRLREPESTLRSLSESIMREVVGDRTIDEVLTFGRQDMENEFRDKLSQAVDKYQIGVRIDQIQLMNVNPPEKVQASFDEVNRAQQEREQTINVARGEFNRVIPRARGEAEQKISEAEGYALERVNEARGDAGLFTAVFEEYQNAPEATRQRLYLETMIRVLPRVQKKFLLDSGLQGVVPFMQLGTGAGAPDIFSAPPVGGANAVEPRGRVSR